MYIFDTREKKNDHIKRYFDKHGIEYRIEKLDTGDYKLEGNDKIVVDRKQNLDECVSNLFLKNDKLRFMREVRRAHESGTHLVILCEHGPSIKDLDDVRTWKSEWTRVTGKAVASKMNLLARSYGVEFQFCDKRHTAKKIIEILNDERTSGNNQISSNDAGCVRDVRHSGAERQQDTMPVPRRKDTKPGDLSR